MSAEGSERYKKLSSVGSSDIKIKKVFLENNFLDGLSPERLPRRINFLRQDFL